MTPEDRKRLSAVFGDALARTPQARAAFLDEACGTDRALRAEVERLLAAHNQAGAFGAVPGQLIDAELARSWAESERQEMPDEPNASPARAGLGGFVLLLYLAAAAALLAFAYGGWLLVTGLPELGWYGANRDGDFVAVWVDEHGPAAQELRPGDRLLALNAVPPIGASEFRFHIGEMTIGDRYTLEYERDGERRIAQLSVESMRPAAEHYLYYVVSLVWCAIGLFIGFARPDKTLARLACMAGFTVGMVFLQVSVTRTMPLFQPLHAVLGYHMCARFPADRPTRGFWRWLLVFTYVCGVLSILGRLFLRGTVFFAGLPAAEEIVRTHAPIFAFEEPMLLAGYIPAIIGMVLVSVRNYRVLSDEDARRRVRVVLAGLAIGLALQVWLVLLQLWRFATGGIGAGMSDGSYATTLFLANTLTIVIPVSLAYAIVKHRVLDIKVIVRKGMQYLLARTALQIALALPLIALAYTMFTHRHLSIAALVADTRGYLYWIATAALALAYRRPLRDWLDRRFFREQRDRERLVLTLMDELKRAPDLASIAATVRDALASTFHPMQVWMWYRDPRELAAATQSDPLLAAANLPASERWIRWLESRSGSVVTLSDAAPPDLAPEESTWLARHRVGLVAPIIDSQDRAVGAILLGPRKSEEPYSSKDGELMTAITQQIAVVSENLRLRARIKDEERVKHEVLARIDRGMPGLLRECPECGRCFDAGLERCPKDGCAPVLSLPVPRILDGKYRLDRLIGKGGMGAVYEAHDLRLKRMVAVKIMLGRAFGQRKALLRFRREAEAAARLNHPNIVMVHDLGTLESEGAFIVMERVRGTTLREELNRCHVLSYADAANWFAQILDGIAAAHAQGVIHRDLKPENVMGERRSDGLNVKILDLGLAKLRVLDEQLATVTTEGLTMGTLGYMAPEQLLGREADERADIFSIGVMLVEALSGRTPFPREYYRQAEPEIELPGRAAPAVLELEALLRSCIAFDPEERPASATALRPRLLELLPHV